MVPEVEKREKGGESFPSLGKEEDIQVQGAKRDPNKINPKSSTLRYIVVKISKVKEKILEAAREKRSIAYKGISLEYRLISQQKYCKPE